MVDRANKSARCLTNTPGSKLQQRMAAVNVKYNQKMYFDKQFDKIKTRGVDTPLNDLSI